MAKFGKSISVIPAKALIVTHKSESFAPLARLRERGWGRGSATKILNDTHRWFERAMRIILSLLQTPSPPPLSRKRGEAGNLGSKLPTCATAFAYKRRCALEPNLWATIPAYAGMTEIDLPNFRNCVL